MGFPLEIISASLRKNRGSTHHFNERPVRELATDPTLSKALQSAVLRKPVLGSWGLGSPAKVMLS